MRTFSCFTVESVLTYGITVVYSVCTVRDRKAVHGDIKSIQKTIDHASPPWSTLQNLRGAAGQRDDPSHPFLICCLPAEGPRLWGNALTLLSLACLALNKMMCNTGMTCGWESLQFLLCCICIVSVFIVTSLLSYCTIVGVWWTNFTVTLRAMTVNSILFHLSSWVLCVVTKLTNRYSLQLTNTPFISFYILLYSPPQLCDNNHHHLFLPSHSCLTSTCITRPLQ